jgi:hypothetical protein
VIAQSLSGSELMAWRCPGRKPPFWGR